MGEWVSKKSKHNMKRIFLSIWKVVKNKYVAVTLVFLLFFLCLSENNVFVAMRLQREVADLERESAEEHAGTEQDSIEASTLFDNPENLEIYGREHYYMKRPNEDIYIVKR